jgi:hypothetical protein
MFLAERPRVRPVVVPPIDPDSITAGCFLGGFGRRSERGSLAFLLCHCPSCCPMRTTQPVGRPLWTEAYPAAEPVSGFATGVRYSVHREPARLLAWMTSSRRTRAAESPGMTVSMMGFSPSVDFECKLGGHNADIGRICRRSPAVGAGDRTRSFLTRGRCGQTQEHKSKERARIGLVDRWLGLLGLPLHGSSARAGPRTWFDSTRSGCHVNRARVR